MSALGVSKQNTACSHRDDFVMNPINDNIKGREKSETEASLLPIRTEAPNPPSAISRRRLLKIGAGVGIAADHGEGGLSYGMREKAYTVYEEMIHIPIEPARA
jgi:hypothetical protein